MKDQTTRELACSLIARGRTRKEVAEILSVSIRTIFRWQRAGNVKLARRGPRYGRWNLTAQHEQSIVKRCNGRAATTIKELVRFCEFILGVKVPNSTTYRVLMRAGLTHKKAVKRNTEYNEERARRFVREVIKPLLQHSPASIASTDEAGFHLNCAPTYGWAMRGKRAVITRPKVRGQKFSLLLCVRPTGFIDAILVERAVDSVIFRSFLERLPEGLSLIVDNASIHKATKSLTKKGLPTIKETAEARSITLEYALPYEPYINPVEYVFGLVKQHVNRMHPRISPLVHFTPVLEGGAFSGASGALATGGAGVGIIEWPEGIRGICSCL